MAMILRTGRSPSGKAPGFGPGIRRFESCPANVPGDGTRLLPVSLSSLILRGIRGTS